MNTTSNLLEPDTPNTTEAILDLPFVIHNLWQKRIPISLATIFCAIFSVIYALYLPNIYKAVAVFLPPKESAGALPGMLNELSSIPFFGVCGF